MRCLLNNLDLTVIKDGKFYYPNGLLQPDTINNNERVIMENVQDGDEFTVVVNARSLSKTSQVYSIIATGCFGGVGVSTSDAESFVSGGSGEGFVEVLGTKNVAKSSADLAKLSRTSIALLTLAAHF
jgi:hypothetical protein